MNLFRKKNGLKKLSSCCFIITLLLIINSASAIVTGSENIQGTATIIRVGLGGQAAGCDFDKIQDAIDAATNFTGNVTIQVTNQQVWVENLNITNDTTTYLYIKGSHDDCATNSVNLTARSVIDAHGSASNLNPGILIEDYENIKVFGFKVMNSDSSGVSVINSTVVNLSYLNLDNNYRRFGGGLYVKNSLANLVDSIIQNNTARNGGGIGCSSGSTVNIYGTEIIGNQTDENETTGRGLGGGIHAKNCNLYLKSSNTQKTRITNNTASMAGGGLYASQGSQVIIKDSTNGDVIIIADNSIERTMPPTSSGDFIGGGGIASEDSGTKIKATNVLLVKNSVNYTSGVGGAIGINGGNFTMNVNRHGNNCGQSSVSDNTMCSQIVNNYAPTAGMAYAGTGPGGNTAAILTIIQTYIKGNTAGNNTTPQPQLAYVNQRGRLFLHNSVIVNNGSSTAHADSNLFLVIEGRLRLYYNTYIDNYPAKMISGLSPLDIEVKNSIITYNDSVDFLFEDQGGTDPTNLLFQCLLINNNDTTAGNDNVLQTDTAALFQSTWPYHIKEDSLAFNRCDSDLLDNASSDVDHDSNVRPSQTCTACRDAGADEYTIDDLIFANGFEFLD